MAMMHCQPRRSTRQITYVPRQPSNLYHMSSPEIVEIDCLEIREGDVTHARFPIVHNVHDE